MSAELRLAARIAGRELRGGLTGFWVFLACLALGIAAIAAIGSVRESIRAGLEREGAALLGGDAEIELTYRFATPEERVALDAMGPVSEIVDFRSMAVVGEGTDAERALTQVKGVDGAYPLYGQVRLDPAQPLDRALSERDGLPGAVMERVLADRLGIAPGDRFRLGTALYRLSALIEAEPDGAASGFALGPRTLVYSSALKGSGLLAPGTLYETAYRLRLPPETDLDAARQRAEAAIGEGMRWRDRRNGAPGIARFVERLSAFLVLVGLSGLTVGGVGVATAVQAHLSRKTETIATLKTLGAGSGLIFRVYLIQIGVLAAIGIAAGLALGALLPILLAPVIESRLPVPAEIGLYPLPLAEAALYGVLAALVFTLWPLARVRRIRAAALFREIGGEGQGWPARRDIALVALVLALLVGAAATLSGMPMLTLYAAGGLAAAFAALIAAAWGAKRLARRLSRLRAVRGRGALRLALGAVAGPGDEALAAVLSLGLGLTVLAAVGQIDSNLRGAIARDLPDIAPSYFVVDIQPGQIDGFRQMLAGRDGVQTVETAPMLRGIITQINGRPAREVAGDHWTLRGDRGVTYAARPGPDTTVTEGAWWPEDYEGEPQISFAAEEAAELGLTLGDRLTLNILGRDIEGTVTSFREVDFSTAGIGFILSMNPAALQGAPHSHIATIHADEGVEAQILRDIAAKYPNITAIRVRDAIDRVTDILGGIAAAITLGAMASLITGGVVLIGTAAAGVRRRAYESAILKTLGAERRLILQSFAWRAAYLGAAAGLVAALAGGLAGWAVTRFVMEADFRFEPVSALLVISGGIVAVLLSQLAFAARPLGVKPARILRARE